MFNIAKLFIFSVVLVFSLNNYETKAQNMPSDGGFQPEDIIAKGHAFFGETTEELSKVIYHAFERFGTPNAYILGQEASGAIVGGLRYGEGEMVTIHQQHAPIFWQGPSIGFDLGAEGARTMMLIYNLSNTKDIYRRYPGLDGSAYFVGGIGMTALARPDDAVIVVPIRTGVGGRLGINIGYLKFTTRPTWNPF